MRLPGTILTGSGPLPGKVYAGCTVNNQTGVAVLENNTWTLMGRTAGGAVYDLTTYDPDGPGPVVPSLIATGAFVSVAGVPAADIARWSGSGWQALGQGLTGGGPPHQGSDLMVFDADGPGPAGADLYVAGTFTSAGGVPATQMARWNGNAWSALGAGLDGPAYDSDVYDPDGAGPALPLLVVAGDFKTAGGRFAQGAAAWDGAAWRTIGPEWLPGDGSGLNSWSEAALVFDADGSGPGPARLYVTGEYDASGGVLVQNIGAWDGQSWSALGTGMEGPTALAGFALEVHDPDDSGPLPASLIAGGRFDSIDGVSARGIARWEGGSWHAMGVGISSLHNVWALRSFDADGPGGAPARLFAGGNFTTMDGVAAPYLASWDGATWSAVGGGVNSGVRVLTVFDGDGDGPGLPSLYAAGGFSTAGGVPAARIARWDGASWAPVGTGFNRTVEALAAYDPDDAGPARAALIAGGSFTLAGSTVVNLVARWDGEAWLPLGAGLTESPTGLTPEARSLLSYDEDGAGPRVAALYVGGHFARAGGLASPNLARWDGTSWSAPMGSPSSSVRWLAAFRDEAGGPDALYIGGTFRTVGEQSSAHIARMVCAAPPCYANCDGSILPPVLNVNDFVCFQSRFAGAEPWADCDHSGALNVLDFVCFQGLFAAGCR